MAHQLAELTREQIQTLAPDSIAVLPTASIEQHGPHMPVVTDTLLCSTVAQRAAVEAADQVNVLVAPVLPYGNSHHHRPWAGVLSLTSRTYMTAVTEILEGLVLSGFRKIIVLNGHGGNTEANNVVGLDFVHGLGHDVSIATAAYWDIARAALLESGILTNDLIPGHAGRFEAAMVMAIRPDLINGDGMTETQDMTRTKHGLFGDLGGGTLQVHGAWAAGAGYTDNPAAATAAEGAQILEIVVDKVAAFYRAVGEMT